jgi:hypothetical protein
VIIIVFGVFPLFIFAFKVLRKLSAYYLDSDTAVEAGVACAIHVAHAVRTDGREYLVGTEPCFRKEWHEGGHCTLAMSVLS